MRTSEPVGWAGDSISGGGLNRVGIEPTFVLELTKTASTTRLTVRIWVARFELARAYVTLERDC